MDEGCYCVIHSFLTHSVMQVGFDLKSHCQPQCIAIARGHFTGHEIPLEVFWYCNPRISYPSVLNIKVLSLFQVKHVFRCSFTTLFWIIIFGFDYLGATKCQTQVHQNEEDQNAAPKLNEHTWTSTYSTSG